jgi:hypothetical protein
MRSRGTSKDRFIALLERVEIVKAEKSESSSNKLKTFLNPLYSQI